VQPEKMSQKDEHKLLNIKRGARNDESEKVSAKAAITNKT